MRVAVEAGRVFAEEVDVLVAVRVDEASALAAHDRQRERRHVDHRPRIAARHHLGPLLVPPARLGIAVDVPALRRSDEPRQIGGDGLDHGAAT